MPLSARARVEVYIPDLQSPAYQALLRTFADEFATVFGGCTIKRDIDGRYLSQFGQIIADRINLIYPDTTFDIQENFSAISDYADKLRKAAFDGLEEEAVLVAVLQTYHSVE